MQLPPCLSSALKVRTPLYTNSYGGRALVCTLHEECRGWCQCLFLAHSTTLPQIYLQASHWCRHAILATWPFAATVSMTRLEDVRASNAPWVLLDQRHAC